MQFVFRIEIGIALDKVKPEQVVAMNCSDCKCTDTDGFYFYFEACPVHEPIFKDAQVRGVYDARLELYIKK